MSGSVFIWLAWAVVLFWVTGAYNRLVRLRSQTIDAFGPLDVQFRFFVTLVEDNFSDDATVQSASNASLLSAAARFDDALKAARGHPLDVATMRALGAAQKALEVAWRQMCAQPVDLAGDPLPDTLILQWQHITVNTELVRATFNRHVQSYNEAIAQFPAHLLVWLFGFKPAHMV